MKRLLISALSSALLLMSISAAEPLKVITSFSILEDFAENIGQEKIAVESIIKRDQDAHSFEPTPKDIMKIHNADVVIINGVDFDNWFTKILDANQYEGIIIDASRNVPLLAFNDEDHDHDHGDHNHNAHEHKHDMISHEHEHEHHDDHNHKDHQHHDHADDSHHHQHEGHDHGEFDPHIWQNPMNAIIMTRNIQEGFALAQPENAPYFENNFNSYKVELEALDHYAKAVLKESEKASMMVLHNSFGYLAQRYDLHFVAVSNINPLAEPSAKKMAELYALVKAENIRAVFSENIAPSRFIATIAKDLDLKNGGILYSDALTTDPAANTYIDLFKHNINKIAAALEVTAKD